MKFGLNFLDMCVFRWCWMVDVDMVGDNLSLNMSFVNFNCIILEFGLFGFLNYRNFIIFLFVLLILIMRKVFFMLVFRLIMC